MAPRDADTSELSESTQRLLKIQEELAKEAQLEQDRLALEALNAGVLDIVAEDGWRNEVIGAPSGRLVAVLWGSKDCRKCKALKPKFIKLVAGNAFSDVSKSHFSDVSFVLQNLSVVACPIPFRFITLTHGLSVPQGNKLE